MRRRWRLKWGVGRFLYDLDVKYLDVKVNGDFKEYYYNGEKVPFVFPNHT